MKHKMVEEPPLENLRKGDDQALRKVYVEYRQPFLNYARKFQMDDDSILDIYQDSIIAMRENLINGKVNDLKSSLKTYLFGIGKYKVYAYLREHKKTHLMDTVDIPGESVPEFDVEPEGNPLTEKQELIKRALLKMGGRCRNILELFYYRGLTIDEIRESEGYENNNTVKSQKSRCLKTLKQMILNP